MTQTVDISGWKRKHLALKRELMRVLPEAVDLATDLLYKETAKNLSGPHYAIGTRGPMTGQMPIPRMNYLLSQSLRRKRLNKLISAVYSDERVAKYNKYVHDGTRRTRPRRFLYDAVIARRPAGQNIMRYRIMAAIRRVGQ